MEGLIFSIEEFAVHDGDGLRTAIFFKGCPLRCRWCHNPEGLSARPQRIRNRNGCLECGRCAHSCPTPEACAACGTCAAYCPRGLIRIAGEKWQADELARHVKRNFPPGIQAGVTLSGGEVFMQPEFMLELLDELAPLHRAIETSGHCASDLFGRALERLEFVFMDVKHMDDEKHRFYTGVGNERILQNLEILKASGLPFVVRVPTIAGVNDDDENIRRLGERLQGCEGLRCVELLPYNRMAGAKYLLLDMEYSEVFAPPEVRRLEALTALLEGMGVPAKYRKQV